MLNRKLSMGFETWQFVARPGGNDEWGDASDAASEAVDGVGAVVCSHAEGAEEEAEVGCDEDGDEAAGEECVVLEGDG